MRKLASILVLMAAMTASARGEDVWFMDGLYKLAVPDGWTYEKAEGYVDVALSSPENSMLVLVSEPNVTITLHQFHRFAKLHIAAFFAKFKGGDILGEKETLIKNAPAVQFDLMLYLGDGMTLRGVGVVVFHEGVSMAYLGFSPPRGGMEFIELVRGIAASFEVDDDLMNKNMDFLAKNSREMVRAFQNFEPVEE